MARGRGWFEDSYRHSLAAKGIKSGRKMNLLEEYPSIPARIVLWQFSESRAIQRYEEYLSARYSPPALQIDDNTVRLKWVKSKRKQDLVPPGYILTVEYNPGRDLYNVKTEVFDGEGRVIRERRFSDIFVDTLLDNPDVFFEGWEKKPHGWFYERPI